MSRACAAFLAAGLLAAAAAADPGPAPDRPAGVVEHWYRLDVDGTAAGWMLSRETVHDERLTTVSRFLLRFKRAATAQTLELESRFVETLDGRPLRAWSRQTLGQQPVETTWEFLPGEVRVEVTHDGESKRELVALPAAGWLTPGQIQPRLKQLLAAGARHFTLSSLDPELGLEVVDSEWIFDGEEELLIDGALLPTRRFRQRQSFLPQVETVANVTADGLTVRGVTPMMGFNLTSTLASRDAALEGRDAPELMVRAFIYPDRPIASPRRLRRARYEIHRAANAPTVDRAAGDLLDRLPSAGAQQVEATGEAIRVLVEVGSSRAAELLDPAELEPYLRASTLVDHRSAGVRRLLVEAGVAARPAPAKAETLRAFVAGYLLDKNLDVILASAGEVAASRTGDCTEHSVLLIALLRAAGIPARAVTGLIYVNELAGEHDLFGYHMWAQAWIDDRWVDLDATLAVPFDAAHIAFGNTALNDDAATLKELARLAAIIGRAQIRVLEAG